MPTRCVWFQGIFGVLRALAAPALSFLPGLFSLGVGGFDGNDDDDGKYDRRDHPT